MSKAKKSRCARVVVAIALLLSPLAEPLSSQVQRGFRYFYDDSGELRTVFDSSGSQLDYTYDQTGNIVQVQLSRAPLPGSLGIINFTPQSGPAGTTVTIQGQNFGSTVASDAVSFNGSPATILSATSTAILATVPANATSGPISVTTGGKTATTSNNFTFIPVPVILSVSPKSAVSGASPITIANLQVSGSSLTGATFSFVPAFVPAPITVNSAMIAPNGNSATLNITIAPGVFGAFTLIATNAAGSSSQIPTGGNILNVLDPNGDVDGDGLTNAVEIAIGTDPLNPQTSGAGLPDGWQVFYGINPLDPTVATKDLDNSGLTVLQDYQMGLSPRNPNRVPPAVSQVTPANGASNVFVNSAVVVRFAEPLLTGTSLFSAGSAIIAALGNNPFIASFPIAFSTLQSYMNRTCCGNSVIPGTVSLVSPTGPIAGTVASSSDGLSVTFAAIQGLSANTAYTVKATGVKDTAGNLMTAAFQSSFTTGSSLDNTPPTIRLTDPIDGTTGLPTNLHYTVQFSKTMDPSTLTPVNFSITDNTAGTLIGGIVQVNADGITASFIPNQALPVGRSFTVTFTTGIKDASGNNLANQVSYSFSTGYEPETAAPHWVANSPTTGSTGAPVNAIVDIQFSEPLDLATITPNIQVSTGGQPIQIMNALSDGDQRITITPVQGLSPNATYTVTIGAGIANLAGLGVDNPGSFTFQTGSFVDSTQLKVTSYDPADAATGVPTNAVLHVEFNKPPDAVTLASSNFNLFPYYGGQSVSLAVSVSANGMNVTLTPQAVLENSTYYCLILSGVEDQEAQSYYDNGGYLTCFYTGAATQTSPLTVTTVNPPNGSTAVPVNPLLEVQLSAPVSVVSVGANAITVTAGGKAVAGTVAASGSIVTFTPSASLAVSTAYTITVGGFTDLAGNAVQAFSSSFTTSNSPVPNQGPLVVNSFSPANGTTAVPVNSSVTITFNEPVNPLTVNSVSLPIYVYNTGVTLAGSYVVNGSVVTFTPLTPLPGSTILRVYVDYSAYVQDLSGNNSQPSSVTFTTAATADTIAPTVLSVIPANGATGIGLYGQVVVAFSKSMNPATLNSTNVALIANGAKQSFNIRASADNRTFTLYSLSLPASSVVSLIMTTGVQDLSGNSLANYESQFTTAAAPDTSRPSVVNQRPGNGATGVPITSSITLYLNKPLDPATVSGALHISSNGQLVNGAVNLLDNGQTVEFVPAAAMPYGALVQVFMDTTATDLSGNSLNLYSGQLTLVGDPAATAPALVNESPMNRATAVPTNVVVHLQYSEPLNAAAITAQNVVLYEADNGNHIAATVTLDATGTILQIVPTAALTANTEYCPYINEFANGLQGTNGLAVPTYAYCFTLGAGSQVNGPTVTLVSPPDGLSNAPVNTNISVIFSGPIDPTTVNAATIQVTGGGQAVVPASIAFSNANQTVQITPLAPLPASTAMTLAISGVTDVAGNPVIAKTTHFTTSASPAVGTPVVNAANPPVNGTGIPINAAISLQASAAIDPTTVTSGTFRLYDQTLGTYVAATYSLSKDGTTVFLLPSAPLAVNRGYTVYFSNYGMTDLAGNLLYGGGAVDDYSFTTGYTASVNAPQVTSVSPANGVTSVPINALLTVQFNEPVNSESLSQIGLTANGNPVSITVSLSNGNQTLSITPAAELLQNVKYQITVAGVMDLSGHTMAAAFSSSFTTGVAADFTEPSVVATDPVGGSTGVPTNVILRVAFNKPLAVTAANFELYPYYGGEAIAVTATSSASATNVTLTPQSLLENNTYYCLYVSGVLDLEGQSLQQDGQNLSCFYTGAATQTAALTVTAVNPAAGTVGVPVNPLVQVQLSAPLSIVSVTGSAITLTAGGQAVAGAVTASGSTVTFTPSAALAVSTAYTVTVGGFTDLAGNAVKAFTSNFTTSNSPVVNQGPLVVNSFSPGNNSTAVPVNSSVVITFNEAVNPLTVNSSTLPIYVNNTGDALAGAYAVNGAVVTFTPLTPLPGNTLLRIYVDYSGYVQDLSGNNAGANSSYFTTAATADTIAPTVLSVIPANGATGVGLNGQIVVAFSKSMNPGTLTSSNIALLANGTKQSFNVSASSDNRTLVLYGLSLPASTVVTLVMTGGVTDLSGNSLASYESQFTTAAAPDTSRPSVVNQRPGNGATGVPVNTSITLYLSKPLDAATVPGALHISANGQLVNGAVNVLDNGQTVQFVPAAAMPYGALVQVFMDTTAQDLSGNALNSYSSQFTLVGDPATIAPALTNASPLNQATGVPTNVVVHLQYSQPLNAATITAQNVVLYNDSNGNHTAATVTLDATGTILQIVPTAVLTAKTVFCPYINEFGNGLQGTNGLAVGAYAYCFTTGTGPQAAAPTISAVSPADGLANVPVNANISVLFSGPIDPTTVTATTIQVTGGGQTVVPASIAFSNGNQTVQITPLTPLPASTAMTLKISGVLDTAGNAVSLKTTHFTTAAAPSLTAPFVLAANPSPNSSAVPVNAAISLQANVAIDPTTVTSSTFRLYDQTLGAYVAATYSLSKDGTTVFLLPSAPLAVNRGYSIYFANYGMADLAGNLLAGGAVGNYSFTTGYTASVNAPQVTSVSPANGVTGVPINAQLTVQFNEAVNSESLSQVGLTANGNPVPVSVSLSNGNQTLSIVPAAELVQNTAYKITVAGVMDLSGHPMAAAFTSSFTTGVAADFTLPSVIAEDPASASTNVPTNVVLRVQFNKQVALSAANFTLYPYYGGENSVLAATVSVNGLSVTLTPQAPLATETYYCLQVNNVVDLEGQNLQQNGGNLTCFYTGAGTQTAAFTVTGVTPPNASVGVPVNPLVQVQLSAPVSVVSAGSNAIVLTAGGQPVTGTVSSSGSIVTFTPTASLSVSTAYTVTVGGFTDLAGNAVKAFTSSFTTSNSPVANQGPLVVNSFTPLNGATGVAVNSTVTISFNEPVNPVTVNTSTLPIYENSTSYTLAGTYSVNGSVVTFTPLTPLPGNTLLRVYVDYSGYVQDLSGNNAQATSSTFTTAATADNTVPTVVSVVPANGATGIGLNGQVTVVFSKSMNPATFTSSNIALLANGTKQSFDVSTSSDNRTLVLYGLSLPASTVVTLVMTSGVTDLSGNALANYESQFTTAVAPDTTRPSVVNQRPGNGATGVPVNTSITLYLNKPLAAATVPGALHISANGQLVNGAVNVLDNGQTVQFVPAVAMPYSALVQVFMDTTATDLSGDALNSYSSQFTLVGDPAATTPALTNTSPLNQATGVPINTVVHLQYSEPLNAATITAQNVVLYNGDTGIHTAATVTLDPTGTILQIAPTAALTAKTEYCPYINEFAAGLQGTNGLALGAYAYCFTTGSGSQANAPAITSISPANGLTGVPVNANIDLIFSGPVDPTTVNSTSIQLTGGGQTVVPASIAFSNNNQTVQITPLTPLPASTAMTLAISGVLDPAGNAVAAKTTHFTTGATPALTAPVLLAANPPVGATGVPVNAAISLQANVAIDPTTVNSGTFQLYDQTLGTYLTGAYSESADGTTVYFLPSTPLAVNRAYTVYFANYGMADLAGNLINGSGISNYSFTTGYSASANAPQVTSVSPANGVTGVPVNAQLTVQFNEPVNSESLSQIGLAANGNPIPISVSLSNGNQTLSIVPAAELLQSTAYKITVAGVMDLSGHTMAAAFTSSFTTGVAADFSLPSVVTEDPLTSSSGVPANVLLRVEFNKQVAVSAANFTLFPYYGGDALALTAAVSANGLSVTLTPQAPLENETYYCLQVNNVLDLEGQSLQQNGAYLTCFYTGAGNQTAQLTVTGVNPINAVGVPVNPLIQIQLSAPVSVISVGSNAITLTAGGKAVAGSVTASGSTVTFTPSGALAVNTAYTIAVAGFTDLAGNAVKAFTSSFTTSNSSLPNQGPLVVNSFTPLNGAAGVAVNSTVTITFNEAVNPLTVNTNTISIYAYNTSAELAGTYAVNGSVVTFTPLTPLPPSTLIVAYVGAYVQDLSGNSVTQAAEAQFTTAATPDKTAPTVVSVIPAKGVTGVGLYGQITVVFSKSMNPATLSSSNISLLANETAQDFSIRVSQDNRTLTLYSLSLPASSVVTLVMTSGVTDLSGNALANYESQFTTAAAPDTTSPSVVNQRPANGATAVPVNSSITLFISTPLNSATVPGALHVSANGQIVNGAVNVLDNGQTAEFVPAAAMPYGALVQVFMDTTAQDLSGNPLNSYSSQFTLVGDPASTTPALTNASPMYGAASVPTNAVIHLQFSEPLAAATITAQDAELYNNSAGTAVTAAVTLDKTGTILQFAPNAALAAKTEYCPFIDYFQAGLQGTNGLAVPQTYLCFTTGAGAQGTAPTITAVSPADGLANVPVNANISVLFSGPIDPTTINATTIQITGGGQTVVPSSIAFSNSNQTVQISPLTPLPASTAMTLAISGVMDLAGNSVAAKTTHFTTRAAPIVATPVVFAANPPADATNVPTNVAISLQANNAIDPTTVNANTFSIFDNTLNQNVTGSYSLSTDGTTIYFLPATALATGRNYSVSFDEDGMTDLQGSLLGVCCGIDDFSFTTGVGPNAAAPQVTAVSPANGLAGVPINAQITVQFNEPVNSESLSQIALSAAGNSLSISVSLSNGNQTLTIIPSAELIQNTAYTLTVSGVTDLAGNQMAAAYTSTFTTAAAPDFSTPSVLTVTPLNLASNVAIGATIQLQFSKLMNRLSITTNTFTVSSNGNAPVAGSLTISQDGTTATFTPSAPLAASTVYTVSATSGIVDLEGQALTQFQSTFTTGTQ